MNTDKNDIINLRVHNHCLKLTKKNKFLKLCQHLEIIKIIQKTFVIILIIEQRFYKFLHDNTFNILKKIHLYVNNELKHLDNKNT